MYIDNYNMIEEIILRVSIIIIQISKVKMFILCDLKGQCLNHDHVAHVYEYMGADANSGIQRISRELRVQNFDSLCVQSSR